MGVVYSGCCGQGGTILVQVNASELASRSGTREKECDLQVLSELGSHSPTPFNVCSSYGKQEVGLRICLFNLLSRVKYHSTRAVGFREARRIQKCATLIITIECWSKNSMKRGVILSKKPLKSSTSRWIFGLQVAHQSHMFPSIQDSEMICCNLCFDCGRGRRSCHFF